MNDYKAVGSVEEFLSPRDNLADYLDPLDYVSMVGTNLAEGQLKNGYTLPELRKVEKQVSAVIAENYPASSVEEQEALTQKYFSLVDGLNGLIAEAEKKEEQKARDESFSPKDNLADYADITEYVEVVRANFAEGKLKNGYTLL